MYLISVSCATQAATPRWLILYLAAARDHHALIPDDFTPPQNMLSESESFTCLISADSWQFTIEKVFYFTSKYFQYMYWVRVNLTLPVIRHQKGLYYCQLLHVHR